MNQLELIRAQHDPSVDSRKQMVSLKTICAMFDWKYDTLWKKFKKGEFIQGYRNPTGRGIRFDLKEVEAWAHQSPVKVSKPSLVTHEL